MLAFALLENSAKMKGRLKKKARLQQAHIL